MKNDLASARPFDERLCVEIFGEKAVLAVNNFDALLEVCKLAKKLLADSDRYNDGCKPENDLMIKLQIAIANAERSK